MKADAINESIGLELDMINIFIRLVQILAMQGNNRKWWGEMEAVYLNFGFVMVYYK